VSTVPKVDQQAAERVLRAAVRRAIRDLREREEDTLDAVVDTLEAAIRTADLLLEP
jgi:CHASE3 domain sensor protein